MFENLDPFHRRSLLALQVDSVSKVKGRMAHVRVQCSGHLLDRLAAAGSALLALWAMRDAQDEKDAHHQCLECLGPMGCQHLRALENDEQLVRWEERFDPMKRLGCSMAVLLCLVGQALRPFHVAPMVPQARCCDLSVAEDGATDLVQDDRAPCPQTGYCVGVDHLVAAAQSNQADLEFLMLVGLDGLAAVHEHRDPISVLVGLHRGAVMVGAKVFGFDQQLYRAGRQGLASQVLSFELSVD